MNYPYLNFTRFGKQPLNKSDAKGITDYVMSLPYEGDQDDTVRTIPSVTKEEQGNALSGISGLSLQMPKTSVETPAPETQTAAPKSSGGLGLEGKDYLNLGLMAGQSILDANAEEKERQRQAEETKRLEGREDRAASRAFMYNAQQDERRNQQQDRAQNLQGLNYLAEQRNQARASARSGAFRGALARAMRGGK